MHPPLEAYYSDLSALPARSALGGDDDAWIVVASGFWRLSEMPAAERARYARSHASVIHSVIAAGVERDDGEHDRFIAGRIAAALSRWGEPEAAEQLARLTRDLTERQEDVAAFRLAYCTLGSLRRALPDAGPRIASMLLVRQGRVVRQLGDEVTAAEHYALAESLARMARDRRLRLEARLGTGVLANVRGNYPEARRIFRQVLSSARRNRLPDVVAGAHQGLLGCAVAAGDADAALRHGWEALRGVEHTPRSRGTLLANLGEACALAGEWNAALRASAAASAASHLARVRLPALGRAAIAAARLGHQATLDYFAREAEREIGRSQQPHENASTLIDLAEAYQVAGDAARGESYRARAAELARARGYNEVRHRAEMLEPLLASSPPAPAARPERAELTSTGRDVVRFIESLELDPVAARMG
ncbi:MAG TPA: hypothetical protein VF041_17420 [Gemmatimonadaceae bacterium]